MRWCYKTVHFDLKKEGFLGSAFLDEAEVEQSMNEYGQAGWELVSIVETQDGLIAFFKQPLEPANITRAAHSVEEYEVLDENGVDHAPPIKKIQNHLQSPRQNNNSKDNDPSTIRIE